MIFGYNTDVKTGENVYHVQTEDRGEKHPVIDSVIYLKGQILDRRRTPYNPAEVTAERIKEMVTQQHRTLVESIRTGEYVPGAPPDSVSVELLNPDSLESNGRLLFHLRAPSGTRVQACFVVKGSETQRAEAIADSSGQAQLAFLLPEAPQAVVLFRAVSELRTQTFKFIVRQQ